MIINYLSIIYYLLFIIYCLLWCQGGKHSVRFIIVLDMKCAGGGEGPEEISGREKNLPGSLKLSF